MTRLSVFTALLVFQAHAAVLGPGVPIVLSESEPSPVHRAARNLQRDLKKVFSVDSPILYDLASLHGRTALLVTGPSSVFASRGDSAVKGWESHGIVARPGQADPLVVLQGDDTRGTIYAIYEFSERFLGIPAAWYWASWRPQPKNKIVVADDTRLIFPSPYVKWRAWYPGDQDLVGAWQDGSPEKFEAWAETMLRMKLNMLEGPLLDGASFSPPYRLGRKTQVAKDSGLAVVGHHMLVFGSGYRNWYVYWKNIRRREPPKLALANVDALKDFWRYHIERTLQEKLEVVWVLALRSERDRPFWTLFPDAPESPAERGATIRHFLEVQAALLREVTGEANPPMRNTFYSEISDLFAQGHFQPPDDPSLISTFVCARRDHFPAEDIRNFHPRPGQLLGYYMNFGFSLTGAHLASAEGPWKMEWSYRFVDSVGDRPLEFSVVNVGNYREFILEAAANAKLLWDFRTYSTDRFLSEFCTTYFGAKHAARVAGVWRSFYDAYWTPKKPDLAGLERQYVFQDMRYARAIEDLAAQIAKGPNLNPLTDRKMDTGGRLYRIVPADNGADNQLDAIENGTDASIARFSKVAAECDAILPALPEQSRPFFNDHLRVQARFMLELNRALNAAAKAVRALPDKATARGHLADTQRRLAAARKALSEAEHGPFADWYSGDRLFNFAGLRERIGKAIEALP